MGDPLRPASPRWRSPRHVRVGVVGGRDERLLDRPGRRPAQQVQRRTCLVVGARRARAAERLLSDDRAGGLVVDVEVARGEAQPVLRGQHRGAVVGDHRPGQRVPRSGVDDVEDVVELVVGVDVHRQDRTEVLGRERLVGRVVGQQHRRAHEIPFAVVVFAADGDGHAGRALRALDGVDVLGERPLVDQRAAVVGQVGDVAVGNSSVAARKSSPIRCHTDRGTKARDAAEHFWPW